MVNSRGADFVDGLDTSDTTVIRKGASIWYDSYSAFHDNTGKVKTDLDRLLKERGVERVYLCGLATDYCVKFTARDALKAGYDVFLVEDACVRIFGPLARQN